MSMSASAFHDRERRLHDQLENLTAIGAEFPEFSMEEVQGYKTYFMELDRDGSGDLDMLEVQFMCERMGQTKTHLELRALIEDADTDASGTIDFKEFLMIMVRPRRPTLAGKPSPWAAIPITLKGRIATSGLASRAKFFEQAARDSKGESQEKIMADIEASRWERKNAKAIKEHDDMVHKRQEDEKIAAEEAERKAKDDADRRAAFKAKAQSQWGGGGAK